MSKKEDLVVKGVCEACSIFQFGSICIAVGCMVRDFVEVGFTYLLLKMWMIWEIR